ncbi:MAG: S8 family serine peptidase, partial [Anaerolineae bacterium]|nr:S8 family serine peptidase [Anaerolineae bacterium]
VAPFSTLVGLRLIGGPSTDAMEANAFNHEMQAIDLKNNSWGPSDNGMTLEGPGPLAQAALANSVQNGRNGLGTIFVWAGGNGLGKLDNQNYDGYVNSIYTVSVGAVTHTGTQSSYSERGACMLVCAPSSSPGITTTDIVGPGGYTSGDYTSTFGGTSSASPAATGAIALILEANPNLGWRDVQEILVQSARKNQPGDTGWFNNGAGFHFNHKFGFGLIDTQAAVALGSTWVNLEPQTSQALSQTGLGVSIPDNNPTGVSRTFDFSSSAIRLEHVTVTANISHTSRGNLEITLTSPSGTASRLAEKHNDTGDNYSNWTFMSVANWGESSTGTWTLKVADLTAGTTGTLNSLTLNLYGTGGGGGNQPPIANAGTDQIVTDTDGNGSE